MNVDAHFPAPPAVSRQSFWQTASNSMYGNIIGVNQVGKCTLTLHSGIPVMDIGQN